METKDKLAYQQPNVEGSKHKMRLQFFNGGDAGEGGEGGQGEPTPTPPANEPTPPAAEPPKEPEKTFTQDDVNNIAAKEAKQATEKLLKQLGIDNFDNAKEGMKQFKQWQDEQKTEAERQADILKALETEKGTLSSENATLKAQLSALKSGVKAESADDVVALAERLVNDDTDIDAAIKQVIEKYPHFAQVEEVEVKEQKPNFLGGEHKKETQSEQDKWMEAFK